MAFKKILALRMWNRFARTQHKIQKLLIQKADALRLTLLTIDMMTVIRERDRLAIANIIPDIRPMVGQFHDYALLYLDLPTLNIAPGFYKLRLALDSNELPLPQGMLVDETDQFVLNVRYHAIDVFAPIVGTKFVTAQRLTVFESFNVTNNSYVIGGTHADGQAFAIVL